LHGDVPECAFDHKPEAMIGVGSCDGWRELRAPFAPASFIITAPTGNQLAVRGKRSQRGQLMELKRARHHEMEVRRVSTPDHLVSFICVLAGQCWVCLGHFCDFYSWASGYTRPLQRVLWWAVPPGQTKAPKENALQATCPTYHCCNGHYLGDSASRVTVVLSYHRRYFRPPLCGGISPAQAALKKSPGNKLEKRVRKSRHRLRGNSFIATRRFLELGQAFIDVPRSWQVFRYRNSRV